jgi:beta-glucosidase
MENNRMGGSMNMDERTLMEVYLPHFKKTIQHGAASVMSAYNKLNGEYCGHNRFLLTDILRNDWGFQGYVTSDWMYGLRDAEKGIKAGMNIEMPTNRYYKLRVIKKLISEGRITEKDIDALVLPVIRTKLLFASKKDFRDYPVSLVGCKEHIALAREVAEKSAVLLKNDNQTLPLDKHTIKRIAVIGSLANMKETGDHGSSSVNPAYIVSPLDGIKNYFAGTSTEVLYAPANDLAAIKSICEKADAVIVSAGTTYLDEGEYIGEGTIRDRNNPGKLSFITRAGILALGGDRKYLHLHKQDIDIIHTASSVNKKVIVCLVAGSAVTVEEWHNEVPAVLETFYNGMEGGTALANILFGDVNPSGKLPFTVPRAETDLPPFDPYAANADYGYYHGYTLFDKYKKTARYPFGYGLSYTSFTLSSLNISNPVIPASDSLHVSVHVKNTGHRTGSEVVQLYIGFPSSKTDRPEKLLRAFKKVELQPNEEKIITFIVPATELAYYNETTKKWEVERTAYQVLAGNSSDNATLLKQNFEIR